MAKQKRSFFQRLTGAVPTDEDDYGFEEEPQTHQSSEIQEAQDFEQEAQLSVDVINTPDEIILKALVAGVSPADLDISITREMVTIKGDRHDKDMFASEDYLNQELFWGSFSRTVVLPEEVEVEDARAKESHGLLVITMPKIDKKRETKLEVSTDHEE